MKRVRVGLPAAGLMGGMSRAPKLHIVFAQDAPPSARAVVERGVDQHNVGVTNQPDYYPLAFLLQDDAGEVLGGVLGDIWGGWPLSSTTSRPGT